MRRLALLCLGLLVIAGPVRAESAFGIHLSDESARFVYATEIFGGQHGPVDMEFGLFFNEDDDTMGHIGLLVRNDTLESPLVISIGTRAYYADAGNAVGGPPPSKIGAITIGGELLFIPDDWGGLGFGMHYFVAPSIVSFEDADGFTEYGVRLNYEITRQTNLFIGYEKIEADLDDGSTLEIESSIVFGINLRFL